MTKRRIFISHRRIDQKVSPTARMIANLLKKKIVNQVFLDVDSNYVRQFPDRLKEEIEKCHIFVLVLPDDGDLNFLQEEGNWVRREIEYALKCNKPILPIITKQDFQWPQNLPESIKALSHNKEGIYGGLNITYYDTNEEKSSIRRLHKTINEIMPLSLLQYIFSLKCTKLGSATIVILFLAISVHKACYPYTDNQAQMLFQTANLQSEKDPLSAMKNYQKVMEYYEDKNHDTKYFLSKFMYGVFCKDFEKLPSSELIFIFKSLEEETKQIQSAGHILDINKKSAYWVGHLYDLQGNTDSCIHYYNEVKDYFHTHKEDPLKRYEHIQATIEKYSQDSFEKAMTSLLKKDYKQAISQFTQMAEWGYAPAQYQLALCFINGTGTTQDYEKAAYWNEKAAKQGYSLAQYNLGVHYFNNKKYEQAVYWYKKAASDKNAPSRAAMKQLSICYRNGWGVTKDAKQADEWLQKAHE